MLRSGADCGANLQKLNYSGQDRSNWQMMKPASRTSTGTKLPMTTDDADDDDDDDAIWQC